MRYIIILTCRRFNDEPAKHLNVLGLINKVGGITKEVFVWDGIIKKKGIK